jgi:cell division protein FtsN
LMEKQKIFWVVLSVTVFVVVVLVVGVFMLKPAAPLAPTETVSPLSDTGTSIYEYSRETPQPATPQPTAPEPKTEQPEVMKITIGENGGKKEQPEKPQFQGGNVVEAAPAPRVRETAKRAEPAPRKPQASKPAAPRAARIVEYWIQTGSYRSQSRAEDLSQLLGSKGLSATVSTRCSDGETFFRVRIGPYANKREAGKFLDIVKRMQGLESSYISSVSSTRYIN